MPGSLELFGSIFCRGICGQLIQLAQTRGLPGACPRGCSSPVGTQGDPPGEKARAADQSACSLATKVAEAVMPGRTAERSSSARWMVTGNVTVPVSVLPAGAIRCTKPE